MQGKRKRKEVRSTEEERENYIQDKENALLEKEKTYNIQVCVKIKR